MATIKKTSGNYTIQTPYKTGASSNITLDTDNVYVTGNLTVLGNTTTVSSNNLTITDNIIMLNDGETGPGVSKGFAGIIVDRGTLANVTLRWSENVQKWQITNDGSIYGNISTTTGGTALSAVVDDPAPVLGGNLNVNGNTIYANVAAGTYVTLQGALELKSANVTPTAAVGSTIFYASDTGAGQAGVFVVNPASTNEELVTKRRAFGFSLLL